MVLPCIGSRDQTTVRPSFFTARTIGGRRSAALSAPTRQISVSRPASFSGLRMSTSRNSSSGFCDGPVFSPSGFLMPRQYSTWAWSGWRVRSPIQTMWPEVAYQLPGRVESSRVSACSKPSSSASWLRSEEHTSELQSRPHLVCRLLLEKKKQNRYQPHKLKKKKKKK